MKLPPGHMFAGLLELFARSTRRGWNSWGAETNKFDLPRREAAE